MNTDMTKDLSSIVHDKARQANALKRLSTFEEITSMIYSLAITQHISGQVFNLDSRLLSL